MTLTADPVTTETTETDEQLAPSVEADAREFGTHINNGGWRLGLIVARSVIPGLGEGRPPGGVTVESPTGKVSARTFATRSGSSHKRVLRYAAAWERAAAAGLVPSGVELDPGDQVEPLPDGRLWSNFYSTKRGEASLPVQFQRTLDKLFDVSAELVAAIGDADVNRSELDLDAWNERLVQIENFLADLGK